ncbi:MAG: hypothetical protein ACTHOU_08345 [Aureliella sp.]
MNVSAFIEHRFGHRPSHEELPLAVDLQAELAAGARVLFEQPAFNREFEHLPQSLGVLVGSCRGEALGFLLPAGRRLLVPHPAYPLLEVPARDRF